MGLLAAPLRTGHPPQHASPFVLLAIVTPSARRRATFCRVVAPRCFRDHRNEHDVSAGSCPSRSQRRSKRSPAKSVCALGRRNKAQGFAARDPRARACAPSLRWGPGQGPRRRTIGAGGQTRGGCARDCPRSSQPHWPLPFEQPVVAGVVGVLKLPHPNGWTAVSPLPHMLPLWFASSGETQSDGTVVGTRPHHSTAGFKRDSRSANGQSARRLPVF